jgi:zinc and cadmium transporter
MSVKKALWYNLLSATTAFAGAALFFIIGPQIENFSIYLLPITAGGFLYIAGSDLIPSLHEHDHPPIASFGQLACMILGIAIMAILTFIE